MLCSKFSGLKANISNSEIADIGSMKGVTTAICRTKCNDLATDYKNLSCAFFFLSKVTNTKKIREKYH